MESDGCRADYPEGFNGKVLEGVVGEDGMAVVGEVTEANQEVEGHRMSPRKHFMVMTFQ